MYNQAFLHRLVVIIALKLLSLPADELSKALNAAHLPSHTTIDQQIKIVLFQYLGLEGGIQDYYDRSTR